jgi:hypothetical protein
MVPEFHAKTTSRFNTGVGDLANQHQTLDTMLLELLIQVRVGKLENSSFQVQANVLSTLPSR